MSVRMSIGECRLEYGFFHEIFNDDIADSSKWLFDGVRESCSLPPEPDWIVADGPAENRSKSQPVSDAFAKATSQILRFECSRNARHGINKECFSYEIDIMFASNPIPPFVNMTMGVPVVVNAQLAEQLNASGLTGFQLFEVSIRNFPYWVKSDGIEQFPRLYQLAFDGASIYQRQQVFPPEANECPFCGLRPLVCPECGFFRNPCSECDTFWSVSNENVAGESDRRIRVDALGSVIKVVDPHLWDGKDFFGNANGGLITQRALDWLLSIDAGPFVAHPIATNIFGLSDLDLERLEAARRPLPNSPK